MKYTGELENSDWRSQPPATVVEDEEEDHELRNVSSP